MIHPSYMELIKVINNDISAGYEPVLNSRYSLVIAAAKRARQIIQGAEPMVPNAYNKKPLSIAVEELYKGAVKILTEEEAQQMELEMEKTQYGEGQEALEEELAG